MGNGRSLLLHGCQGGEATNSVNTTPIVLISVATVLVIGTATRRAERITLPRKR